MKRDEKRLAQLNDDSNNDRLLNEDIPLLRAGLLHLNWTDRAEGRVHPFVTPSPLAIKYLSAHSGLRPADRRTLRKLACVRNADIDWAKKYIQPNYD